MAVATGKAMKLVVDNTNVETLPVGGLSIASELRTIADELKPSTITAITLLVSEEGMNIRISGETASHYELMGLFEAAKLRVFADDVIED